MIIHIRPVNPYSVITFPAGQYGSLEDGEKYMEKFRTLMISFYIMARPSSIGQNTLSFVYKKMIPIIFFNIFFSFKNSFNFLILLRLMQKCQIFVIYIVWGSPVLCQGVSICCIQWNIRPQPPSDKLPQLIWITITKMIKIIQISVKIQKK